MEHPEHIWFLISRNLSGEATPGENEELRNLLQQQPQLMQQYDLLKNLWRPEDKQEKTVETDKISHILQLSKVEDVLKEEVSSTSLMDIKKRRNVYRWATVFITLVVFAFAFNKWFPLRKSSFPHEIVTQKGSRTRTFLPDGSTVWLNAGSSIRYGSGFNSTNREITLYGEAYFDVVKDAGRPFIVHAGEINIKVMGTVFNVKSYPEDKTIETTLFRGLVQITIKNAKRPPIYLHPNQKIILSQDEAAAEISQHVADVDEKIVEKTISPAITYLDSSLKENEHIETAWVYNRLQFRGDNFKDLAKKLERWYDVIIHFEDDQVMELTFNGSLENETITQAFHALQTANHFNYKIRDNEIFISSSK